MLTATLVLLAVGSWAQTSRVSPDDALIDLLVWGADLGIDLNAYAPEVQAELGRHLARSHAYRSPRRRPANSSELDMVYAAQVRYERRLVAVTDDARASALAVEYVDALRPCYEWEGLHDCPEREARFATQYQTARPTGPFREYLPLLAAHRWLCTAEAYDREQRPDDAERSRRTYEEAISLARRSRELVIRMAAEGLTARDRCVASR
jgi:hypothetical protein